MAESAAEWRPAKEPEQATQGRPKGLFSATPFVELMKNPQPQRFLIAGLLYEDGIDLSFGGTGSFKSFDKLHQGLCVATGLPYHGRDVIHGAVL
jgi:hypothetical protein